MQYKGDLCNFYLWSLCNYRDEEAVRLDSLSLSLWHTDSHTHTHTPVSQLSDA